MSVLFGRDRKSTRLNSSHTEIYTLSLHDALPISPRAATRRRNVARPNNTLTWRPSALIQAANERVVWPRSEEHTSELQSHRDLHSFPTRRSSDLASRGYKAAKRGAAKQHAHVAAQRADTGRK